MGALGVLVGESARTAGALGDVVPGELDVHPAQIRSELSVDAERQVQLLEDVLEAARLDSAGGRLGVAVHRIAHPQHRLSGLADRFDRLRERGRHLLRPEAVYEREPAGLILRVEGRHQARSEEHTSELQSQSNLVCRLLLEKKKILNRTLHAALA